MTLDLSTLAKPISLRPATALTDEELIRFSEINKPYKIERNHRGEITIMTPVGGIGGTHELYVATELAIWTRLPVSGSRSDRIRGSIFATALVSRPMPRGCRWRGGRR